MKNYFITDEVKSRRIISFLISIILIFSFTIEQLNSQAVDFCGVLPYHQATSQHPDSIYYDRFGNTYDIYEPSPAYSYIISAGYYNILYNGPQEFVDIINLVFADMATLIPRKDNYLSCGPLINQETVSISITTFRDSLTKNLMRASATYVNQSESPCKQLNISEPNLTINSGKGNDPNIQDGMIQFNLAYDWHLGYSNGPASGSNQFDFRSVLIHEILHILGFSSAMDKSGLPTNIYQSYELFDNYLYRYDVNGNQETKVIIGDCIHNCWELNPEIQDFDSIVLKNCKPNATYKIGVGSPFLKPVAGLDAYNNDTASVFSSYLAHLHPHCMNWDTNLIMQPLISKEKRRVNITNAELEILCKLGYNTPQCSGCHLGAYVDFRINDVKNSDCCSKIFSTCVGKKLTIPIADILCNDASGSTMHITSLFSDITSGLNDTIIGDSIEITGTKEGLFRISYTNTACDCKQHNAYFTVLITSCIQCTIGDPCQNLICQNEFEEFKEGASFYIPSFFSGGVYFVFDNYIQNTPDICKDNSNKYIQFARTKSSVEGISLKLHDGVAPGCMLKITFDGATNGDSTVLDIRGSSYPPCVATNNKTTLGCNGSLCNFNPECLGLLPIDNVITAVPLYCPQNVDFSKYDIEITNNTAITINYITLNSKKPVTHSGVDWIYMDNIKVTRDCTKDIYFTYNINCADSSVSFSAVPNSNDLTYLWNFGDNDTGSGATISHTYLNNGTYIVSLSVEDECKRSKEFLDTIVINCDPPLLCNCPPNSIVVGTNTNSTTEWDDVFPDYRIVGGTVCVNGTLLLNQQLTALSTTFIMGPGARIQVLPNKVFIANACTFTPCSDMMYKGIEVFPNGDLTAIGCTFYDAHIGIDFFELSLSTGGIGQNTFERNFIGVNVGGPVSGLQIISNNKFQCNGVYLNPYLGQPARLGVPTKTYAGIRFNGATGWDIKDHNEFNGIQAGVRAENSSFIMNDNKAIDLISLDEYNDGSALIAKNCPMIKYNKNLVMNSGWGVAVESSNFEADSDTMDNVLKGFRFKKMDNKKVYVKNSKKIDFTDKGIHLTDSKTVLDMQITGNKINSLSNAVAGIYIEGNGPGNTGNAFIADNNQQFSITGSCLGIIVSNYDQVVISNNTINMSTSSASGIQLESSNRSYLRGNTLNGSINGSWGIDVSASRNVIYCCNSTNNTTYGFNYFDNCSMSQLRHNNMTGNNIGLRCDDATWIGEQQLGFSNRWPGAASYREADHLGSIIDMQRSRFDATPPASDFFPVPTPPADWFRPRTGNNRSCQLDPSGCPTVLKGNSDKKVRYYGDLSILIDSTDQFTANPSSDWGTYGEGQSWNAKISLLNKLDSFPELLGQSSIVDSFYSSNTYTEIREYLTIRNSIQETSVMSDTQVMILNNYLHAIDSGFIEINIIDSLLTISNADTISLLIQRDSLIEFLSHKNLSIHLFDSTILVNRNDLLQSIYTEVDNLSPQDTVQKMEKIVNKHLIQYYMQGNDYLTNSVQTSIFSIANQCMHEQDYAIGLARMLFNRVNDYRFNDDSLCVTQQPIITSTKNQNNSKIIIDIYPNPSENIITISCNTDKCKIRSAELLSLSGLRIKKINLVDCENKCQISTSNVPKGCYFMKTKLESGLIITKKICIQ